MEVSGKVTSKSMTNFNLYCIPCDTDGLKEQAYGFCQDCQEHLCQTCFQHHRRSTPSRNHVLLDKDAMPTQQTTVDDINAEVITDNCTNHRDKPLEFYCNNHKTVACYICVTLEHKQCKVDYIPAVSGNISGELIDLNKKMEDLVKKCENNIMKASAATKQLEQSRGKVVEDIRLLRKEINDRLDQMESMMIKEAEAVVNTANYKLENIQVACEKIAEEVKRSQSFLNALKEAKEENKLFIVMKNVTPRMMTLESEEIQIVQDNMTYDVIQFDRNQKLLLLDHLKNGEKFGTISTYRKTSEDTEICVNYERSHNVTFPSDKEKSNVIGMVMVSATQMVIADYGNKRIKKIDVNTGSLLSEKTLSSTPWDVIKLPQNKLAIALPNEKYIQIMSYADTSLSLDRRIDVGEDCYCVAYCQDKLVVGCNSDPGKLIILGLDGNMIKVFDTPGLFYGPEKIVISSDEKSMYISDHFFNDSKCIKLDWQGNVVQRFEDQFYKGPQGIQELSDGTLLVCYSGSRKIVRLSGSLKKCEITGLEKINLRYQKAVTYNESNNKLYVSCSSEQGRNSSDTIKVFNVR